MLSPMLAGMRRRLGLGDGSPALQGSSHIAHVTMELPLLMRDVMARARVPEMSQWPSLVVTPGHDAQWDPRLALRRDGRTSIVPHVVRASNVRELASWLALPESESLDRYTAPFDVAIYVASHLLIEPGAQLVVTGSPAIILVDDLVIRDFGQIVLRVPARVIVRRFEKRPCSGTAIS